MDGPFMAFALSSSGRLLACLSTKGVFKATVPHPPSLLSRHVSVHHGMQRAEIVRGSRCRRKLASLGALLSSCWLRYCKRSLSEA